MILSLNKLIYLDGIFLTEDILGWWGIDKLCDFLFKIVEFKGQSYIYPLSIQ